MGFTIPQLILFITAFTLYLVKPSWLMLLWLISEPLLGPFIVLFSGVTDFEEQQMLVWGLWGVYNRLFLLILIVEFIRGHKLQRKITYLFPSILCIFTYFIFHNIVTFFSPNTIIREWLYIIYAIVPLLVFLMNKKIWPSLKAVFIVVIIVCTIQLLFIPLNMSGIYAYSGRYIEILNSTIESGMVPGTFTRSNMMADYLAVVYFLITLDYFSRKSISFIQYIIVSTIIIIPLLLAGSKLPIIVTFVNIILCIVCFERNKLPVVFVSMAALIAVFVFLRNNSNEEVSSNEGMNRIVNGIGGFSSSKTRTSAIDESTLVLSSQLLEKYFWSSPLIGHGNAYDEDENAYPIPADSDLSGLNADATLAFYLVEFGIMGLFLFLFFQYSVIKFSAFPLPSKYRKTVVILVFIFFLLFAVTERGLFNRGNFLFLFTYFFGLARFYNEEVNKSLNLKKQELSI